MRYATIVLFALAAVACASTGADAEPSANVKTALRVFLEKMGEGRFDRLDEIYGPGFVAHGGGRDYTLEQDNESGRQWRAAFPDLRVYILRTVGDEAHVAVHWRAAGTNTAAVAGFPGNGAKATLEGMTFFRFDGGRIVEEWSLLDMDALRAQLKPPPAVSFEKPK
jgi:steroid delta-isomerase-like uncharacterized protein